MRRLAPFLIAVLMLVAPRAVPAQRLSDDDVQRVAVLELRANNVARDLLDDFLGGLVTAVDAVEGFEAVSREQIVGALGERGEALLEGCNTVDCLVGLARAHSARYLLVADLTRELGGFKVELQLVDMAEGLRVADRVDFTWEGEPAGLHRVLRPYLHHLLLGEEAPAPAAALEVSSTPPGATILIDGDVSGRTPLEHPLKLPQGQYAVRLELQAHRPWERPVVVTGGETTRVEAALDALEGAESSPFYTRWWFWAGVGAAAVTGVVLGLTLGGEDTGSLEVSGRVP